MSKTLLDYLPEFVDALTGQMKTDQLRWGNTWKIRPRDGQEERCFARFRDYYDQYKYANIPIPWMKIVGESLIAWVRENHPEYADE